MQGKSLFQKNMNEIIVDGGLNQHHDDMNSEEIIFSANYCVCLKDQ